ncbi:hypothetical protein DRI50_02880, partial [candidate division KSB1 bacterium]
MRWIKFFSSVFLITIFSLMTITCTGGHKVMEIKTSKYPIVPRPQKLQEQPGQFVFNENTALDYDNQNKKVQWVVDFIRDRFGVPTQ